MAVVKTVVKPVGFRTPIPDWYKFKAKCYEEGYKMSDILSAMIKLFVSDQDFRKRIIEYLNQPQED